VVGLIAAISIVLSPAAFAADEIPGVSATEIKVGATFPFSGPASPLGNTGKAVTAYVNMLNDGGGINGRKINYLALDDAYSPPKAVEHIRRLVESDEVAFIFSQLGTPGNSATIKYLNTKKVPDTFIVTGASKFTDFREYPYTTTALPSYDTEGKVFAKYIDQTLPNGKIAILYQNDDLGKDFVNAFKAYFKGDFAKRVIVASYEVTDPTVDSQVVNLKNSGAEAFLFAGTPKFAAQTIRKKYELGWNPLFLFNVVAASIASAIQPAGPDKAVGAVSTAFYKDPNDPQWKDDPSVKTYRAFMEKYMPGADLVDVNYIFGYIQGQILERLLKQAGQDLTRDNIVKQARSISDFTPGMMLPGIAVNTNAGNSQSITRLQLQRWNGTLFERFGDVLSANTN
jgi:ABC-type branched-subunit amino acid transport system substrate-binding protein